MSKIIFNEKYKNDIERILNSLGFWKETGEITYDALLEADKGGDTVDARGIWYKAKTKTGKRAWYTPDGTEAVAETPAGAVYGTMLLDGMPDAEQHKHIYATLGKGGEMPSFVWQTRMICTPEGCFEPWEWDTKAQAWATTDGRKVYVETDKGLIMGLALWREYRD